MALVGLALYVVARTSRAPLWSPTLSRIALVLWNAGGRPRWLVTLSAGVTRGPQEYREWVWPVAVLFAAGRALNGANAYLHGRRRAACPSSTSRTGTSSAAFCFLTDLFVTATSRSTSAASGNTVVQGYFMHTAVGMWFTMLRSASPTTRSRGCSAGPSTPTRSGCSASGPISSFTR